MTDQLARLVDGSDNFRFLAEPALLLAGDAAAAESYINADPDAAMAKARRFSETLAKMLVQRAGLNPRKIGDQNSRIEALATAGAIPEEIRQAFHSVRRAGNEAVHGYPRDREKATAAVATCFTLGAWWYRTETGKEVAHPFTAPAPAATAPVDEKFEIIEAQLARLRDALEARLRPAPARHLRLKLGGAVVGLATVVGVLLYAVGPWPRPPADGAAGEAAPGPRLAAVTSWEAVSCRSTGWMLPSRGTDPVPYTPRRAPAGAILASGGQITVTVQGLSGRSVVLQSMSTEVVRRSPALAGTYLPLGCQGEVTPRKFRLDLDASAPEVVPEAESRTFPYKVDESEPEQFLITPEVTGGDVEFRLLLNWTSGADEGVLVLPEAGKPPFRVTAPTAAREFCLDPHTSTWRPSCV
ncbi:DUF4145 domain-containing protein [Phytohabitans kaempferiae]|uniref:DUF4145 domain-containing protein n=1 Tax=Phytohabitans kaempferiae TaxID=1620943 RepID=A0ABV6LXQ1_9ACTN